MTGSVKTFSGSPRPPWLRPGSVVAVVLVHAAVALFLAMPHPDLTAPIDSIEITIAQGVPEPEPPPPEPAPDVKPDPPPPPPDPDPPEPPPPEVPPVIEPPPPEPPPEPLPIVVADPPKRVALDAPAIPARAKPKTPPPPRQLPPETPPPEPTPSGDTRAQAQLAQARATYASKVLQEIRAHRISTLDVGSVGVSFTIDASGEMVSVAIVRSAGKSELDSAALRMVRSARPGPPPDGVFSGTTTINFIER